VFGEDLARYLIRSQLAPSSAPPLEFETLFPSRTTMQGNGPSAKTWRSPTEPAASF
jgi:hypothetical protein